MDGFGNSNRPDRRRDSDHMGCPADNVRKAQAKLDKPEPWFILHILTCDDCRDLALFLRMVREVYRELTADPVANRMEIALSRHRLWEAALGHTTSCAGPQ
jgi:hypothetical protein